MNQIMIEMPIVKKCSANQCAYNVSQNCRAKAITIGDVSHPGCDTFFASLNRTQENKRIAGVGACKISECLYNEDFECAAQSISVGQALDGVRCLTFVERNA